MVRGKTIIVTGAAGGMGRASVELLLNSGAKVVATDLQTASLAKFSEQDNFVALAGDLLDETHVKKVFHKAQEVFGTIDGLANVLGIAQRAAPIESVSLENFHKIININMTALFLTCKEAALYMKKQKQGKIVNVGSVATTRPRPGLQSYVAAKGAAEAFTKALALELAPYHVNANVLHPGPADTTMLEQFTAQGFDVSAMKKETFEKSVPLGRLIEPIDIAQSIQYLLSDAATMITGAVLHVDGGRNI